jgi:hypothetical protein
VPLPVCVKSAAAGWAIAAGARTCMVGSGRWGCPDQFEGRSRLLTWATSIAVHVAMSQLRRRRWKDVSLDDVLAYTNFTPQSAVDPVSGPGDIGPGGEFSDLLNRLFVRSSAFMRSSLAEVPPTRVVGEDDYVPASRVDDRANHEFAGCDSSSSLGPFFLLHTRKRPHKCGTTNEEPLLAGQTTGPTK